MAVGPVHHVLPGPGVRHALEEPLHAVCVGGGLAGLAAATVLTERGARVTVLERETFLGGRAGAWTDTLSSGESFQMERGFHAFFRQYYNLREWLRRIDPSLSLLEPLEDYPILGPEGREETFAGLPKRTPWNVIALTQRTPTLGLTDLLRVDKGAALEMLRFSFERTYGRFDELSAGQYLDSLGFPPDARAMLFDVFAHSFFNPEREMSAAELLMQFHFYFVGNPEGLVFDVLRQPFSTAVFQPFARHLRGLGATLRTGADVRGLERRDAGWRVTLGGGEEIDADLVVLATSVEPLKRLVAQCADLDDAAWRARVASLDLTLPFAVWRLWLDRPCAPGRAPFAGTTGVGLLDNISLYHLFEDESRDWARRSGGAVVELHAYGVPLDVTEEALRADLLSGLHTFYPETKDAKVLEERYLLRRDCPGFMRGSFVLRPEVATPFRGLALAGDFVKLPMPSALMERAVTSGFLAANTLLAPYGVEPEPLRSVPLRGMLAGRNKRAAAHR